MPVGLRRRSTVWIGIWFGLVSIGQAEIRFARHTASDLVYASGREVHPDATLPEELTNIRVSSLPGIQVACGIGMSKHREFWLEIRPLPEAEAAGTPWRKLAELPRTLGVHPPVVAFKSIWTVDTTTEPFKLIRCPLFTPKPVWKTVGTLPDVSVIGMGTVDANSLCLSRDSELVLNDVQQRGNVLVGAIAAGADRVNWSVRADPPDAIPEGTSQQIMVFDIAAPGTFLTLTWEDVPQTVLSYRTSTGPRQLFGPWSETYSQSPITINQQGQFIQYRLERHAPEGVWPREVILTYELDREPEEQPGPTISPELIPDRPLAGQTMSGSGEDLQHLPPGTDKRSSAPPSDSDSAQQSPRTDSANPSDVQSPKSGSGSTGGTASPQSNSSPSEQPAEPQAQRSDSRFQPLPAQTPQKNQIEKDQTSPSEPVQSTVSEPQAGAQPSESTAPQTGNEAQNNTSATENGGKPQATPGEGDGQQAQTSKPAGESGKQDTSPNGTNTEPQNERKQNGTPRDGQKQGASTEKSGEEGTDSDSSGGNQPQNNASQANRIAMAGSGGGGAQPNNETSNSTDRGEKQPAENQSNQAKSAPDEGEPKGSNSQSAESDDSSQNKSMDAGQSGADASSDSSSPDSNASGSEGDVKDDGSPSSGAEQSSGQEDSEGTSGEADSGGSEQVSGPRDWRWGNAGTDASGLTLPQQPIMKQRRLSQFVAVGVTAVLGMGGCLWLLFFMRRRKHDSENSAAAEENHPVSISVSESPSVNGQEQQEAAGIDNSDVDTTPTEEARTTDDTLEWEVIGVLPGELDMVATQHPRFIYSIDASGRVFRFAHDALPEEPTRPPRALCFSPVRRNCVAMAASANHLVAIGAPGVGDVTVALANLTENGGVEHWHTIPYPSNLDVPVAVALRNKAIWILGTDGTDIQLVRSSIQDSGPSRAWHVDARAPLRGELLGGAIVPRMGIALTDCPDRRSYLSVLKTPLGEKTGFQRVADLPWSGREVAVTSLGPELYVMDRGGLANEGHISHVPLENSDRPRAWLTGPSGLEIHGSEFFFQTHKGKLIVLHRALEAAHTSPHAPWILTSASPREK